MKGIEAEFKRADHLLYVSLKYTKTTDVIKSVLDRWKSTIDLCIDRLLLRAKRTKKIKAIPVAPLAKAKVIKELYGDEKIVKSILHLYLFFRRLNDLEKSRYQEFRKHVALVVKDGKKEVRVDMPTLFEWNELMKEFIIYVSEKV